MTKSVVGFSRVRDRLRDCSEWAPAALYRCARCRVNEPRSRCWYCRHPGPNELMPQRLEQLGLDARTSKSFYMSTYRVCSGYASCKAWRLCARPCQGDVQVGMGSYCLNTLTIDALLVDRPPWVPSRGRTWIENLMGGIAMSEVLQYYQTLIDDEVTLICRASSVFAFQFRLSVGRKIGVVTPPTVTSITLVGGPSCGLIATPSQMLSIHDRGPLGPALPGNLLA
jgi:hypothetical protein